VVGDGVELPGTSLPSLIALMRMTYGEWDEWTRGSAIRRAGYGGLKRNVAVALGNWGAEEAVPVLVAALADAEPLVRGLELPRFGGRFLIGAAPPVCGGTRCVEPLLC
jgi:epoxyqueuosine reductase QueG